ncbi:MAG: hypothetical protein ABSH51_00275 [Solirubrobacteraceae bacterium]|jgi:hypothetical protein
MDLDCARLIARGRWVVVTSIMAVTVAACGSASSSSSRSASSSSGAATSSSAAGAATTGSASGSVSASTLASLKTIVTKAEAVPAYTNPGPAVSGSVVKGSSMVVFPINSQIDACQTQAEDFAALGKSLGANVTLVSNSGQPSQWQSAVQDATGAHDKAVAMQV